MKPIKLADFIELIKKYLPFKTVMENKKTDRSPEEFVDITGEQKIQLNDVIDVLVKEYLPINENVIKQQLIDQIEFFGKRLVSFGEANSLSIITDYGKQICHYVNTFEIDSMMKTLKLFPDIIEKLKLISGSATNSCVY